MKYENVKLKREAITNASRLAAYEKEDKQAIVDYDEPYSKPYYGSRRSKVAELMRFFGDKASS